MDPFSKLVELFMRFPGVGARQARRFSYFLLAQDPDTLQKLSQNILQLKRHMTQCTHCYRYFNSEYTPDKDTCPICDGPNTDKTTLMIVEKDVDIESVRKSAAFDGRFFVLGGLISLSSKKSVPKIRTGELINETDRSAKKEGLKEIIFGLTLNTEGEHTREILMEKLKPLTQKYSLTVTTLGRGFSTGTELEYSDDDTLKNALKNRY